MEGGFNPVTAVIGFALGEIGKDKDRVTLDAEGRVIPWSAVLASRGHGGLASLLGPKTAPPSASIPGTEPQFPPPAVSQPPYSAPVGFRTMGEAVGPIIWESGVGVWGRIRALAGIVGNLRLWGAVALANAIDELFAEATEGVIGQEEAARRADKLEERVRKEMRAEQRRQERREDAQRAERISAQAEEIAIWTAHGQEILAEQRRIEAEDKRLAEQESKNREAEYERAVKDLEAIQKAREERLRNIATGIRGLLGFGVQLGLASITKQATKQASVNVNYPSFPPFPDTGEPDYFVPPGVSLGLTPSESALLGSAAAASAEEGQQVCYIRKPRKRRRKKTTRRICYEREIR